MKAAQAEKERKEKLGPDEPAFPELDPAIAGEEVEEIIVKNPVPDIDKKEYLSMSECLKI